MVRIALSPESRWAAAGHHQGQSPYVPAVVTVWDVASGRSRTLPGSLPGDDVAFSPDGRWLVVGGVGDYRFYRVGSWHPGAVLPRDAGDSTPGPLAFARDGSLLAIARTLMGNPDLLLLDEPSEGLAPLVVRQMLDQLKDLKASGTTLLLSEQNLNFSLQLADRAYVIEKGEIKFVGKVDELKRDEEVLRKYLMV